MLKESNLSMVFKVSLLLAHLQMTLTQQDGKIHSQRCGQIDPGNRTLDRTLSRIVLKSMGRAITSR